MGIPGARLLRRLLLEIVGWLLVLVGLAALVLPGPGLILIALGLIVLSQQYAWAERRLEPVKQAALLAARQGVQTIPRIACSFLGVAVLLFLGVFWCVSPDPPQWWPVRESWWLPGGWGTGISLLLSGVIAAGTIVWSIRRFRLNSSAHTP